MQLLFATSSRSHAWTSLPSTEQKLATSANTVVTCMLGDMKKKVTKFLDDLKATVSACQYSIVVGGDFNLIRGARDKNNNDIDWSRVNRFNDCLARLALRKLHRGGGRFTWTNEQLKLVRSVLDKVFVLAAWESLFPLCSLLVESRIGSDHSPLLLDLGESTKHRSPRFFFKASWFKVIGFGELIWDRW